MNNYVHLRSKLMPWIPRVMFAGLLMAVVSLLKVNHDLRKEISHRGNAMPILKGERNQSVNQHRPGSHDLSEQYLEEERRRGEVARRKNPAAFAAEDALKSEAALADWLASASTQLELRLRINKTADLAQLRASEHGDFSVFSWLLRNANAKFASQSIATYLPTVTSGLGISHDLTQKLKLVDDLQTKAPEAAVLLRRAILHDLGLKIVDSDNPDILHSLSLADLKGTISGASQRNPGKTLEMVQLIQNEAMRIQAQTFALSNFLSQDSNGASSYVAKLGPGPERDQLVAAMVRWLIDNNDSQSASQWIQEIRDPILRKREAEKLEQNTIKKN